MQNTNDTDKPLLMQITLQSNTITMNPQAVWSNKLGYHGYFLFIFIDDKYMHKMKAYNVCIEL